MQQNNDRKKLLNWTLFIISGIVIIALFLWIALLIHHHQQQGTKTTNSGQYYDPNSHETVSNPPGKTPDTYGTVPNKPIFLGVSSFLQYGITLDQVNGLEYALYQYSHTTHQSISQFSINISSIDITPHNPNTTSNTNTATFKVVMDRKTTVQAKLDYSGLSDIELYLFNEKGTQIYTSGVIDGLSQNLNSQK